MITSRRRAARGEEAAEDVADAGWHARLALVGQGHQRLVQPVQEETWVRRPEMSRIAFVTWNGGDNLAPRASGSARVPALCTVGDLTLIRG